MFDFKYEVHPVANLFPMMTDEEFQALKADIEANGQAEYVVVWRNQLIDGRNRVRACKELGRQVDVCELDDDRDPLQYVISHNLHRRHLTTSQRSMVAGKMANMPKGGDRKTETKGQNCTLIEEAAKALNVSQRSVKTAKQVLEHGSKDVIEAVERGELPVSLAAKFVVEESDKREQSKIVKQGRDAVKKHITSSDFVDEPSPATTREEDEASDFLGEFKKFWKKVSPIGKRAIRVWLDENYLEA